VKLPNWQLVEQTLFEKGKSTIAMFAHEHPDIVCSFFVCSADPYSGDFAFCFDTPENASYEAMKQELFAIGQRQAARKRAGRNHAWKYARAYMMSSRLDYAPNSALFQYPLHTRFTLDWREFSDSRTYPVREAEQDSYLEGHTRLAICAAIDRLIADRVFLQLLMTSPFRIGYQFHDEHLIVLRFLNWPTPGGKTIYSVLDSPLARRSRSMGSYPTDTEQAYNLEER
jgi:hypothetical protein